jgi:hypothetical protein
MKPLLAIIGAGPGRPTLARLSPTSWYDYKVFDLRPVPSHSSGSMLYDSFKLHIESIERALPAPNLHEEFLSSPILAASI